MTRTRLKKIDLRRCCRKKSEDNSAGISDHPDIFAETPYLAKIDGQYFAGQFEPEWYGWSFDGWGGGGGLQLDKPGTNASLWQGLWEIVEVKERKGKKRKQV